MRGRFLLAGLAATAAFAASISLAAARDAMSSPPSLDSVTLSDTNGAQPSSLLTVYAPRGVPESGIFQGFKADMAAHNLITGVAPTASGFAARNVAFSMPLIGPVSLDAGYNLDLQNRFNGYDLHSGGDFDGLFLSPSVNAPYANFASGSFVGATLGLTRGLQLHFGQSTANSWRDGNDKPVFSYLTQARSPLNSLGLRSGVSFAGVNWNFSRWGALDLSASRATEQFASFGGAGPSTLGIADGSNTSAAGVSAHIRFGSGWVTTVSYAEGISQLNLRASNASADTTAQHSRAYGVAIAKRGLFANSDSLGVSVSRPLQSFAGGLATAKGLDDFNGILSGGSIAMPNRTQETDFEMGYVTTFLDGAVALQANAAWQQNLAGQPGVNSLAVLSRAKINF